MTQDNKWDANRNAGADYIEKSMIIKNSIVLLTQEKWEDRTKKTDNSISVRKDELKVRQEYLESLEKIDFVSSSKGKVFLSEIFVWPEFEFSGLENTKKDDVEGSYETFLGSKNKLSIIKWFELSWKTSIWNKLFIESMENGYYPIIIDAKVIQKNSDYNNILKKEFASQYNWNYKEYNEHTNKVAIIDNYHQGVPLKIITQIKENFNWVIVLVDEEEYMVYFREDRNYAGFDIYSINTFGSKKQHDLIINWKKNEFQLNDSQEVFEREVETIENKINDIVTKGQIVPRSPFYILSIVQIFEWFIPHDYQITAYWHCYNALITSQLIKKGVTPQEIGDCFNFLSYMAYRIFDSGKLETWGITIDEYEVFKSEYAKKFLIKKHLISRIENNEYPILKIKARVKFEQSYIYYYFTGKYLAEKNLSNHIVKLCASVYKKEYSNILVFTIHHTTNHEILDEIQLHCMISFDSLSPAKLTSEETQFVSCLMLELPKSILSTKTVSENITNQHKELDSIEKEKSEELEQIEKNENIHELVEINKSLKIIEVLWQILKNRAGNLEKDKIQELLLEVEKLWLRLLTYFLHTIKSQDFYDFIETKLSIIGKEKDAKNKYFSWEERRIFIEKNIQMMWMGVIMGMLSKIFYSVNIDKLVEIQKLITKNNPFPAFEFLNLLFKLSHEKIAMDDLMKLHSKFEDEKNTWALRALSYFLQWHMNTHSIDYKLRQQICSMLKISYTPNKIISD